MKWLPGIFRDYPVRSYAVVLSLFSDLAGALLAWRRVLIVAPQDHAASDEIARLQKSMGDR